MRTHHRHHHHQNQTHNTQRTQSSTLAHAGPSQGSGGSGGKHSPRQGHYRRGSYASPWTLPARNVKHHPIWEDAELSHIFENNKKWVEDALKDDPDFFSKLKHGQVGSRVGLEGWVGL